MTDNIDMTSDAAGELRQFIERWEMLASEKQDISDAQKEVMAEAKGRGYDTKAMRIVIAMRKKAAEELAEQDAIVALYREAVGI